MEVLVEMEVRQEECWNRVSTFAQLPFSFFSSLKYVIPQCKGKNKRVSQTCFPNYNISEN